MTETRTRSTCTTCDARRRMWATADPPEVMRHRYPPNGDVDEWVRWGPAGAPPEQDGGR